MLWGIRVGDRTIWLDGSDLTENAQVVDRDGPLIRTQSNIEGIPGAIVQEVFVHSDMDILVARLRVSLALEGDAIWYADASPCATLVPELPSLERLWSGARDFAAFVDGSVVYHVRPTDLASPDWQEALRWAQGPEETPLEAISRDGVWIAYTCLDGFLDAACGPASGTDFTFSNTVAAGDCASAAVPNLVERENERSATMLVAFGASREDVDRNLAFALEQGYDGLLTATRDAWKPVLDGAAQRVSPTAPELKAPLARALATLITATSQESGAIVRASGAQPLLALDYPRHSVWAGLALDSLGLTETSERHLRFLLSHVRTEDKPSMPAGSIPAALYGDGTPGLPHTILDADATGWLLWAVQQHSDFLGEAERDTFVAEVWPQVQILAGFLLIRSDPGAGIPLYSFDPRSLKEAATEETLVAHYIGLRSAVTLSRIVQEDRPEWETRVEDLADALDSRAFSADGAWIAERPLSFWAAGILDADDPRWETVWSEVQGRVSAEAPDQAMRDLCELALLWRDQPDRLERLKPLLIPVITGVFEARPIDTLDAARTILSIIIVDGS